MMLGSMDSCLPPKGDRNSFRRPLRQLSLGQDPLPASPLISTRNLIPGLSESVVQLDKLGKGGFWVDGVAVVASVSAFSLCASRVHASRNPGCSFPHLSSHSKRGDICCSVWAHVSQASQRERGLSYIEIPKNAVPCLTAEPLKPYGHDTSSLSLLHLCLRRTRPTKKHTHAF